MHDATADYRQLVADALKEGNNKEPIAVDSTVEEALALPPCQAFHSLHLLYATACTARPLAEPPRAEQIAESASVSRSHFLFRLSETTLLRLARFFSDFVALPSPLPVLQFTAEPGSAATWVDEAHVLSEQPSTGAFRPAIAFLHCFIRAVEPIPAAAHLRCLAALPAPDWPLYRALYSYSRIYELLKEAIRAATARRPAAAPHRQSVHFSDDRNPSSPHIPDARLFYTLIKLLDNSKLTKQCMRPVIEKLTIHARDKIVDGSAGGCAAAIAALVTVYPALLNEEVVAGLSCYYVGIVGNPHNHIFLGAAAVTAASAAARALLARTWGKAQAKVLGGLLRETLARATSLRGSSVREELAACTALLNLVPAAVRAAELAGWHGFKSLDTAWAFDSH